MSMGYNNQQTYFKMRDIVVNLLVFALGFLSLVFLKEHIWMGILLHEGGHWLMAKIVRLKTVEIVLPRPKDVATFLFSYSGGTIRIRVALHFKGRVALDINTSGKYLWYRLMMVVLAGPLTNLVIMLAILKFIDFGYNAPTALLLPVILVNLYVWLQTLFSRDERADGRLIWFCLKQITNGR